MPRRLSVERKLERKWVENFKKCPLINREDGSFSADWAYQLFRDQGNESYPSDYPQGFYYLYRMYREWDRDKVIDKLLTYLHFIGIELHKEKVIKYLDEEKGDFNKLMKKSFFILRTLALYKNKLDLNSPYKDNYGDIYFLLRIETEGRQLDLFENTELELKIYYGKNKKLPDGYEDNQDVKQLFNKVENSNRCFFITGKAGTGKSTFIHYFTQKTQKQVLLCAFTGIAAVNIGGQTIHSLFKFPLKPFLPEDDEIKVFDKKDWRRMMIERTDTLIIDEVSMLRSDLLEAIDFSLKVNGGDHSQDFGGKQLLFIGDIFQLPPVVDSSDEAERFIFEEVYKSYYFFNAPAYEKAAPALFEFQKSYRQENKGFVALLDQIRDCRADETVLSALNKRHDSEFVTDSKDFRIMLTTNNEIAKAENNRRLSGLNYTLFNFQAEIKGNFSKDKYPTDLNLELKKQAQIIFIKNDANKRWVNGTIAKVTFVSDDFLEVKLQDGSVHQVFKETWENRRYKYDKEKEKIVSEVIGTFTQYPIKLAWAITIHKSQGLTFDKVVIDLGSGAFVNGQLYTALSRCRTLDGIILKKKIHKEDVIEDRRLIHFYETEKLLSSLQKR